jgi:hypothetical protein
MKITSYHVGLCFVIVAPLLGACSQPEGEDPGDLAKTTEALSGNPNPCALGTDPNFTSATLTNVGSTANYVRSEAWINDICVDIGEDRKTTIVDFPVPGFYQHQTPETYRFDVQPDFWGSASTSWSNANQAIADCANTQMATRIQRWDWATSQFVQLDYREQAGAWVWDNVLTGAGHCNTPRLEYYHENYGTAQSVATNKYRVRSWAKQPDGSYATVYTTGTHTGF